MYTYIFLLTNIYDASLLCRCMLLFLLLISVTADCDNTDCGAGGVRDDYCLSLSFPCSTRRSVAPPTRDGGAAGWAVVHHCTARRGVLLYSLRPLWRADRLRRRHLKIGHIPENSVRKKKKNIKCTQTTTQFFFKITSRRSQSTL